MADDRGIGAKSIPRFLAAIITAFLIHVVAATAETATVGPPEVVDGETVRIAGKTFRLYGIDAPDIAQTCEIRGRTYNCGRVSMTALMDTSRPYERGKTVKKTNSTAAMISR